MRTSDYKRLGGDDKNLGFLVGKMAQWLRALTWYYCCRGQEFSSQQPISGGSQVPRGQALPQEVNSVTLSKLMFVDFVTYLAANWFLMHLPH